MIPETTAHAIAGIVRNAQRIVILQADNPDGDSLGSALALEQILGDMGKQPFLYCGMEMPTYLRHLEGWDRVSSELPQQFDASIIVDASALSLFGNLQKAGQKGWIASKPLIILDHHDVTSDIDFATVLCNLPVVATGEVIYELARALDWPLNLSAKNMIAMAILADSLGLTTEATTARSIHIIGELVEGGVSISELEQKRRDLMRKSPELVRYKGRLLERVEYFADNRIASITIPWAEIQQFSPLYNPPMLVMDDMRLTTDTQAALAFKQYSDGHMTVKIRCNPGFGIANELAQHFGGGGHAYASGFKTAPHTDFAALKADCIQYATELLDKIAPQES